MPRARTATLFSGGGTLESGLVDLIDPVFAAEYAPDIAAHYHLVFGGHVTVGDVRDIDYEAVAARVAPVDYLHASPVCKEFSRAKACAASGEKELDREMGRAVARALWAWKPVVFSLENVDRYLQSDALRVVEEALSSLGYAYDKRVYNAAAYGAATRRKRLILRAAIDGVLPAPGPEQPPLDWWTIVRGVVDQLPDTSIPPWALARGRARGVDLERGRVPYLVAGGSTDADTVPILAPGRPAITFKATTREKHRVVLPGGRAKAVTPEVVAMLTGMPSWYALPESRPLAVTILGNGIPPPLSRAVLGPLLESHLGMFHGRKDV